MSFSSWLRSCKNTLARFPLLNPARRRARRSRPCPLYLEVLEDRSLPSTFTVVNTDDAGDGSLRQAIIDANAAATGTAADPDVIQFAMLASDANHVYYRNDDVAGQVSLANVVHTSATDDSTIRNIDPDWAHSWWSIQPLSALPPITDTVVLDGYTQDGASPNTLAVGDNAVLKIVLDGHLEIGRGLWIQGSNCTVRGLVIDNFTNAPILAGAFRTQTVDTVVQGNYTVDTVVQGNYIGLDVSGSTAANHEAYFGSWGIWVAGATGTCIGGTTSEARNVIAGFWANILLESYPPDGPGKNVVQGNYLGTNATGTAIPAGSAATPAFCGIWCNNTGNTISGNTIAFINSAGVRIEYPISTVRL